MDTNRLKECFVYSNQIRKKNGVFRFNCIKGVLVVILTFLPSIIRVDQNDNFISNPSNMYWICAYFIMLFTLYFNWIFNCSRKNKSKKTAFAIYENGNIYQIIAKYFDEPYRGLHNGSVVRAIGLFSDYAVENSKESGFRWEERLLPSVINNPNQNLDYETVYYGRMYSAKANAQVREILQIHDFKKNSKRIKIKCDYMLKNTGKIKKNKTIVIYCVYKYQHLLENMLLEKTNI